MNLKSMTKKELIEEIKQRDQRPEEFENIELQNVFDAIQDGISVIDTELAVIKTNRWMEQMYEHSMPIVGQKCYHVYQHRQSPCTWCPSIKTIKTGETHTEIVPYPSEKNPSGWIELSTFPVKDKKGHVINIIEYVKDITERKKVEDELHEREDRLSKIMIAANDGMWDWDLKTNKVYFDPRYYTMAGYTVDEFPYQLEEFQKRIHPDDIDHVMDHAKKHLTNKIERFLVEFRFRKKNDDWLWIMGRGIIVERDEKGAPQRFVGTHTDITERKQAEQAMRESEEKYRNLILHSQDAIYLLYNRRFEVINDKFQEIFGMTLEDVNKPDFDFINLVAPKSRPSVEDRIKRTANGEKLEPQYVFTALNAEGKEILVETAVSYIKYKDGIASQGIIRDITERQRLEEQLRQAQKMEAVGQLAGGVAHDFNNLLTVINGYSDMIMMQDIPQNLKGHVEQIKQAGDKAIRLTSQLLGFSRKQVMQPKVLNLNTLITEQMKMLGRLLGENIQIMTLPFPNLNNINADPGQIEQIILNIAINARDAMPMGGKLTIETKNVEFDVEYINNHAGAKPGEYVMLAISDTGEGMDELTKARLFEPFFTTKDRDKGTGLGLATVFGIVKQNNGFIYVYSKPKRGTTFKIYLPLIEKELNEKTITSENRADIRGQETILLVEDDHSVLELTRSTLIDYGYNVLTATNGEDALRVFHEQQGKIELLLTDVIMPEMGGRKLADIISAENPKIKIIYCSGYTDNSIVHHGVLDAGVQFIQKPYSQIVLAKKVRQVLDGI